MSVTTWLAVLAVVLLGLLLNVTLIWTGQSKRQQRRKARVAREVAAAYRKYRASDSDATKVVTVAELVGRIEAEGLPVRLNWQEDEQARGRPNEEEWPTGVIRTVDAPARDES